MTSFLTVNSPLTSVAPFTSEIVTTCPATSVTGALVVIVVGFVPLTPVMVADEIEVLLVTFIAKLCS